MYSTSRSCGVHEKNVPDWGESAGTKIKESCPACTAVRSRCAMNRIGATSADDYCGRSLAPVTSAMDCRAHGEECRWGLTGALEMGRQTSGDVTVRLRIIERPTPCQGLWASKTDDPTWLQRAQSESRAGAITRLLAAKRKPPAREPRANGPPASCSEAMRSTWRAESSRRAARDRSRCR